MVSALDSGESAPGSSPGRGHCVVFLGKTLYSHSASLPRCINGYQRIVGENLTICGGVTCDGLASSPGEVKILPAASCYRNRDKLRHQWALRPLRLRYGDSIQHFLNQPKGPLSTQMTLSNIRSTGKGDFLAFKP